MSTFAFGSCRHVATVGGALALAAAFLAPVHADAAVADPHQVSVSTGGVPGDNVSSDPASSADGRYIVFTSVATNLVAGDTNGVSDVFLRDRIAGTTVLVSRGSAAANGASYDASVSDDGRYVAFTSEATNLAGGVAGADAFVKDMVTGVVTRVGNGATQARISGNGRFVAYVVGSGTRRFDRVNGTSVPVNAGAHPAINSSGRYVVTQSSDADGPAYLDTDLQSGTTTDLLADAKASPDWSWGSEAGAPVVSSTGRYAAFHTDATGLNAADDTISDDIYLVDTTNGSYIRATGEFRDAFTPRAWDQDQFNHADPAGFALSGNGRVLAFMIAEVPLAEFQDMVTLDRVTGLVSRVHQDFSGSAAFDNAGTRIAYSNSSDVFTGGVAACTVDGTDGPDVLTGTSGADVICGRGGDDTIEGLGGDDVLAGGPGTDTVSYVHSTHRVWVRMYAWFARGAGEDEVFGFENADGSSFDDTLNGDFQVNRLRGFAGNDTFEGRSAADTCVGGAGTDTSHSCETTVGIP